MGRGTDSIKSRRGGGRAALLFALASSLGGCAGGSGPGSGGGRCEITEVATLPVLTARGVPMVRATLNGTPVAFMVDSGAASSTVTTAIADRLGLPVDYDHRIVMRGVDGSTFVYGAQIRRLGLGTAEARQAEFWRVDGENGTVAGLPFAGLFGGDFLANYDVLYDLPARRIVLYRDGGCRNDMQPPIDDPAFPLPFTVDAGNHIAIEAKVNGHAFPAVLDTGAARTLVSADDAAAAGVNRAALAKDRTIRAVGIAGRGLTAFLHQFDSFQVGGETRRPALLSVADTDVGSLVGEDFLRRNQVWVLYPHGVAWVHPVGPVTVLPPKATK